ncbi:LOW QUALITY PROTEIN: uncharacterized protein ACBR49_002346 [Aulostomus maculatus]
MDMSSLRPELFDFHGVSMTHYFTENWENVQKFQARPDDILIATYPKAGTTWVSYILDLLLFGHTSPERQTSCPIYERVPFLEITTPDLMTGKDLVDKLPTSPRLIKTHFPVQFVPKSFWEQNCRIVYVARNAKDNVVSFFHFDRMNMIEPDPGDWNSYLQRFMQGKRCKVCSTFLSFFSLELRCRFPSLLCCLIIPVVYGSWYNHVNIWWKKKQTYSKLHYMFYEDLIEETGREIDKLCCFLGLSPSANVKKIITDKVQFDDMKQNDMTNHCALSFMDFKISPFMRKGKVGDWKNHFTVAQNEQFDEDYKKKMSDPSLQFRTEIILTLSLTKMELPPRATLYDFHGVSMTKYFTGNWENLQNFKARPDDIVVATYPKAGTTWVSYILDLLYFRQTRPERQTSIPLRTRVPFLEISVPGFPTGTEVVDQLPNTPRLIKTHLPVQFLPKSFWEQNCRVVYMARNAKDSAVSYFHFGRMNVIQPEPGDWSTFLQNFMEGKVVFGSWYDHVNGWWEKKQTHSKIHFIFYEDLIEDCGREIDRLCSYLGLSPSAEEKRRVLTEVTFENMKQNKLTNFSNVQYMNHNVSPFMRKGKVGDWKNHFTVAQNEQFDEDYKQRMKNPTLEFRTEL